MNRQTSIIVAVLGGLVVVLLLCAGGLLIWGAISATDPPEIAAADATATALVETATAIAEGGEGAESGEATATPEEIPPPDIEVIPTATPLPTDPPTDTPAPTATVIPATDTPAPTATNPPPPVIVPTNPPPPPPTNPPATNPPPPTQPPPSTSGISATHFALQDRSNFTVGGEVWFEFTIANANSGPVEYGAIGVMPKKDGADRPDMYQHSYGGSPGDVIPANGFSHEDRIILNEGGGYTLRLVICFQSYDACLSGGGSWITLSQEIGVTISG